MLFSKTNMTNSDFMSARNPGIPPVKLLFDKSLTLIKAKNSWYNFSTKTILIMFTFPNVW